VKRDAEKFLDTFFYFYNLSTTEERTHNNFEDIILVSRAMDFLICLKNITQHINPLQVDNLLTNNFVVNSEAP
jgi:elongation factor P hydroxylase